MAKPRQLRRSSAPCVSHVPEETVIQIRRWRTGIIQEARRKVAMPSLPSWTEPSGKVCQAPRADPSEFWEDVHHLAERFGLDAQRLAAAVKRGRVVLRLQAAQPETGGLMAARDRDDEPSPEGTWKSLFG